MNAYLIFCGGMGVGTLVVGIIFIWALGSATKKLKQNNAEETKRSLDLLAERNQIQKGIAEDIKTIALWCEKDAPGYSGVEQE